MIRDFAEWGPAEILPDGESTYSRLDSIPADLLGVPVCVIDREGALVSVNRRARELLHSNGMFRLDRHLLRCRRSIDTKRLVAAIERAIDLDGTSWLPLDHREPSKSLIATVTPAVRNGDGKTGRLAYVVFGSFHADVEARSAVISSLYGLSSREAGVGVLVAAGHKVEEVSRALGISVGTVRVHMRNIYKKMSINKQTELTMRIFMAPILGQGSHQ